MMWPSCSTYDGVLRLDLIEDVRRPQDRESLLAHETAHDADDVGPRLEVEPDRRLVEEEKPRRVDQGARDLDPPGLAAGKGADLVVAALGELDPLEQPGDARLRFALRQAVQGGVIEQVLPDRQVGVEGPALEHDAEAGERLRGRALHVEAENPDLAGPVVIEPRDDGEERRLAGPVRPEQGDEGARRNLDRNVGEGLTRSEPVPDAANREGRARGRFAQRPSALRASLTASMHSSNSPSPSSRTATRKAVWSFVRTPAAGFLSISLRIIAIPALQSALSSAAASPMPAKAARPSAGRIGRNRRIGQPPYFTMKRPVMPRDSRPCTYQGNSPGRMTTNSTSIVP